MSEKEITKSVRIFDAPINQDRLDLQAKKRTNTDLIKWLASTDMGALLGVTLFGSNVAVGLIYAGASGGLYIRREVNSTKIMRKIRKIVSDSINDDELHFSAERCAYQSQEPLKIGEQVFQKGDNFFYIQLPKPEFPQGKPTVDLSNVWLDVYDHAFQEIKTKSFAQNYQFVAINVSNLDSSLLPITKTAPQTERAKLFARKGLEIQKKEDKSILLTREEFENLLLSPREIFLKGVEALDDRVFSKFLHLALEAQAPKEREKIRGILIKRLDQILTTQVEAQFNSMPDIILEYAGEDYFPIRRKAYMQSMMKKTESGFYFVQVNTTSGETRWVPLDRLLKTEYQPIEAIINSPPKLKKAQLAYVINQIMSETPFEDLIRTRTYSSDELVSRLKDLGVEDLSWPKDIADFGKRKKGVLAKTRSLLSGLLLYSALRTGFGVIENREIFDRLFQEQPIIQLQEKEQFGFPESIPPAGIEWKIEGAIPSEGYYITGTSHSFENGKWKINDKISRQIYLPSEIPEDKNTPFLLLNRIQEINQFSETKFRIPIRENTKLSALKIVGPSGSEIKFEVFELADGSVEVHIPFKIKSFSWVEVSAVLTPVTQTTIHATGRLPKLNENALSEEINQQLHKVSKISASDEPYKLFSEVKKDHEYSLSPPGKEQLSHAKTPEEIVNVIASIPGCSCEVCNTEAVLGSANLPESSPAINMAFGYIVIPAHLAGAAGGFIRTETAHAFGIDENGTILDATPTNPASDELTQQYLNLLNNPAEGNITWDQINNGKKDNAQDQKNIADGLKAAAAILAGSLGFITLRQGSQILRKHVTRENAHRIADEIVTTVLTESDFQQAYDFFGWLSWANDKNTVPQTRELEGLTNLEALNRMRQNIHLEKMAQYLEKPKAFERVAKKRGRIITNPQSTKLRLLARYILTS